MVCFLVGTVVLSVGTPEQRSLKGICSLQKGIIQGNKKPPVVATGRRKKGLCWGKPSPGFEAKNIPKDNINHVLVVVVGKNLRN